ncbi:MAG: GNAT family N-acetyltransferase [Spirochaetales bacterium]|nr:GNAT family N-acetyltransferase [Spirochaetales bacterium]
MIRRCNETDGDSICAVINNGATAYRGVIPPDRLSEPYMSRAELNHEIGSGVDFWGWEEDGELIAVMGLQPVRDVTLIRHAYVTMNRQRQGVGRALLTHLMPLAEGPILIGTWKAASWAIQFYQKNGFELVNEQTRNDLLRTYWDIPDRQIETSVVLREIPSAAGGAEAPRYSEL